jgi:hypothetical protein
MVHVHSFQYKKSIIFDNSMFKNRDILILAGAYVPILLITDYRLPIRFDSDEELVLE